MSEIGFWPEGANQDSLDQLEYEYKDGYGSQETLKLNPEVSFSVPEVEPFLHNEELSPFSKEFGRPLTGSLFTNETSSDSNSKARRARWLKREDRHLIRAIMLLQHKSEIIPELLMDSLNKNTCTQESWTKIKAELKTDRPLSFLQKRYKKLSRNQSLNRHEELFFNENLSKFSLEEFQIIFPGKTKQTLARLKEDLVTTKEKSKIAESILAKSESVSEAIEVSEAAVNYTLEFNGEMSFNSTPYINFTSSAYLDSVPQKVLRKLQYSMQQVQGQIYAQIAALKSSIKDEIAQKL